MKKSISVIFTVLALLTIMVPGNVSAQQGEGDPYVLAHIERINQRLKDRGQNIAIEEIEFFTIGGARPSKRHSLA